MHSYPTYTKGTTLQGEEGHFIFPPKAIIPASLGLNFSYYFISNELPIYKINGKILKLLSILRSNLSHQTAVHNDTCVCTHWEANL